MSKCNSLQKKIIYLKENENFYSRDCIRVSSRLYYNYKYEIIIQNMTWADIKLKITELERLFFYSVKAFHNLVKKFMML